MIAELLVGRSAEWPLPVGDFIEECKNTEIREVNVRGLGMDILQFTAVSPLTAKLRNGGLRANCVTFGDGDLSRLHCFQRVYLVMASTNEDISKRALDRRPPKIRGVRARSMRLTVQIPMHPALIEDEDMPNIFQTLVDLSSLGIAEAEILDPEESFEDPLQDVLKFDGDAYNLRGMSIRYVRGKRDKISEVL